MTGCQAYVGRGVLLARGGRRLRPCSRQGTEERVRTEVRGVGSGPEERTYRLCGQHAAQWDRAERGEAWPPTLEAFER